MGEKVVLISNAPKKGRARIQEKPRSYDRDY
jgi:hypothetical protein